jgi:mono/diheme cytochrome c family protein
MSFRTPGLLLIVFLLADAADLPGHADAAQGGQLARQWCASCHVIEPQCRPRRSTGAAELSNGRAQRY